MSGTPLTSLESAVAQCRVDDVLDLSTHEPRATLGWEKADAIGRFREELAAVAELQTRLYAGSERAMLVVLQAIDAGGKGGTIRSVMSGLDPAGIDVTGFGVPSRGRTRARLPVARARSTSPHSDGSASSIAVITKTCSWCG